MRYLLALFGLLYFASHLNAQEIRIHRKTEPAAVFQSTDVDSITFNPCDTNIYERAEAACAVDIDDMTGSVNSCTGVATITATVSTEGGTCGGCFNYQWKLIDAQGNQVGASTSGTGNSGSPLIANYSTPLPGAYTVQLSVTVSCENSTDDDEDELQLEWIEPSALFSMSSQKTSCNGNTLVRTVTVNDQSGPPGTPLTHTWLVTGASGTPVSSTPPFVVSELGALTIEHRVVTNELCTASYTVVVPAIPSTCQAVISGAKYSWCDTSKENTSVSVQFENQSTFTSCPVKYVWDFGDGSATSSAENPQHTYANVNKIGQTFNVKLTVMTGVAPDICSSTVSYQLTLKPYIPDLTYKICCDGRVDFYNSNADEGSWDDHNTSKKQGVFNLRYHHWPFTNHKIEGLLGSNHYWQYYDAGVHTMTIGDATNENGNVCSVSREFTVPPPTCLSRNDRVTQIVTLNGVQIKLKFRQKQGLGITPKLVAKVRSRFLKKFKNASATISGEVYFKDQNNCYCGDDPNYIHTIPSNTTGSTTNSWKAKVVYSVPHKFRTKDPSIKARFHVELKDGTVGDWELDLGNDCDLPKHPSAFWN